LKPEIFKIAHHTGNWTRRSQIWCHSAQ